MSCISDENLKQLKQSFPRLKFKTGFLLSKITYFKIGGKAELLVKVEQRSELIDLIKLCRKLDIKFTILGGASNVIVADEGVAGLVILTRHDEMQELTKTDQGMIVQVDSGMVTALLVKKTVQLGLTGLEPFVGVPGRLGGAILNNAHYQQKLISEYVDQVEVLTASGDIIWLTALECEFGYDQSRFQHSQEIILRVKFKLPFGDQEKSQALIKESTLYRIKTQPLNFPSSGCIFKNVVNTDRLNSIFPQFKDQPLLAAGFLIDQAGLKGAQQGAIQVSDQHAAFMINTGGGTANDVSQLIEQVKTTVKAKYGVELQEEVFWVR